MVDSKIVLWGQMLAYTFYCIIIILLMGWFRQRIAGKGSNNVVKPALFYTFVGFLTVLGVSLHLITTETIPWVKPDLHRAAYATDQTFHITVENHQFKLPFDQLVIKKGQRVLFDVTSNDLTYGFGLFRQDNSMLFQMQVVPGHKNQLLWEFHQPGVYSIRSTEYSGPKGIGMVLPDAVSVVE